MENIEVCLGSDESCIFKYIQKLLVHGMSGNRNERIRRIWEPTYTIMYRTLKEGETRQELEKITDSLHSKTGAHSEARSCQILSEWDVPRSNDPAACTIDHVLQLLQRLYAISMEHSQNMQLNERKGVQLNVPAEEFVSKKLTNKLNQQTQDRWCWPVMPSLTGVNS